MYITDGGGCARETTRSRCHTFRDICERNREDATKRTGGTRRTGIRPPSQTPATTELENQMISLNSLPTVFLFLLIQNGRPSSNKNSWQYYSFFHFLGQKRRLVSGYESRSTSAISAALVPLLLLFPLLFINLNHHSLEVASLFSFFFKNRHLT